MDAVIAILLLLAGATASVYTAARIADRRSRRHTHDREREVRTTPWTVSTRTGPPTVDEPAGSTRVLLRRVTAEGSVLDCVTVAVIPGDAWDWAAQVGQARAEAESRAALLNSGP